MWAFRLEYDTFVKCARLAELISEGFRECWRASERAVSGERGVGGEAACPCGSKASSEFPRSCE